MHLTCANSKIQTVLLRNREKTRKKDQPSLDLGFHFLDTRMRPKLLQLRFAMARWKPHVSGQSAPACLVIMLQAPHLKVLPFLLSSLFARQKRSVESGEKSIPCDSNTWSKSPTRCYSSKHTSPACNDHLPHA